MKKPHRVGRAALVVMLAASICVWSIACNEDLLPEVPVEQPFSMYGVISPELDTQSVRIYPIEQFLTSQDPGLVDQMRVTSTQLETGETRIWEGVAVTESNGKAEIIFRSPFPAKYGAAYRIEVERTTDGQSSYAEVRVPEKIDVEIDDSRPQRVELAFRGQEFSVFQPVVGYLVQVSEDYLPTRLYEISYAGQEVRTDDGWRIMIRLASDREMVQSFYNNEVGTLTGTNCDTLWLRRFTLDVHVGNKEWYPPGGVFDPNVLVQEGTMSNVQNGFGFIGAGYRIKDAFRLSRETIEGACFNYLPG